MGIILDEAGSWNGGAPGQDKERRRPEERGLGPIRRTLAQVWRRALDIQYGEISRMPQPGQRRPGPAHGAGHDHEDDDREMEA